MLLTCLLLVVVGIASGFFNVVAGGGSLLSVPVLIFLGLPSAVANGTNRLSILAQNVTAVAKFKNAGHFDKKLNIMLSLSAIPGAIVGTLSAVNINDTLFNKILAGIMVMVLISTFAGSVKRKGEDSPVAKHPFWLTVSFFFIGFYGGFIQAGVGFIIIATLSIIGQLSLVRTNSVKVFVTLIYTIPSFILFIVNGKVDWVYGIMLALGNALGGWLGGHFSVTKGDKWIRIILAVAVTAMAVKLLLQ